MGKLKRLRDRLSACVSSVSDCIRCNVARHFLAEAMIAPASNNALPHRSTCGCVVHGFGLGSVRNREGKVGEIAGRMVTCAISCNQQRCVSVALCA